MQAVLLKLTVGLSFRFSLDLSLLCCVYCHCFCVLFAFVVLDLVSSVLSQEIG